MSGGAATRLARYQPLYGMRVLQQTSPTFVPPVVQPAVIAQVVPPVMQMNDPHWGPLLQAMKRGDCPQFAQHWPSNAIDQTALMNSSVQQYGQAGQFWRSVFTNRKPYSYGNIPVSLWSLAAQMPATDDARQIMQAMYAASPQSARAPDGAGWNAFHHAAYSNNANLVAFLHTNAQNPADLWSPTGRGVRGGENLYPQTIANANGNNEVLAMMSSLNYNMWRKQPAESQHAHPPVSFRYPNGTPVTYF
jgi:hypothetical protein